MQLINIKNLFLKDSDDGDKKKSKEKPKFMTKEGKETSDEDEVLDKDGKKVAKKDSTKKPQKKVTGKDVNKFADADS